VSIICLFYLVHFYTK
jgi:hypothetical protein